MSLSNEEASFHYDSSCKEKTMHMAITLFLSHNITIPAIAYDYQNDNPLIIHKNTSRSINSSPYAVLVFQMYRIHFKESIVI